MTEPCGFCGETPCGGGQMEEVKRGKFVCDHDCGFVGLTYHEGGRIREGDLCPQCGRKGEPVSDETPYTEKHEGPAFVPPKLDDKGDVVAPVARAPTVYTAFSRCPKCQRHTYITRTTEKRAPYNKLGCFWDGCKHEQRENAC